MKTVQGFKVSNFQHMEIKLLPHSHRKKKNYENSYFIQASITKTNVEISTKNMGKKLTKILNADTARPMVGGKLGYLGRDFDSIGS